MNGLTNIEVKNRINNNQTNKKVEIKNRSYKDIIIGNVFTYFNLINFVVFVLIFFTGSYHNTLFMGVVISNTIIGIFEEISLKRKLDKLSFLREQTVRVIRDSKKIEINSHEVVLDDIIYLEAGSEIPTDCVLIETEYLEVNEALLTGEADAILKKNGDELLGDSFVVSGVCYAKAIRVGMNNFSSKVIKDAKKYKKLDSQIQDGINKIIKIMSLIILPLGIILFISSYLRDGKDVSNSIIQTGASIIGMIPSGLYLITTVTAALSIIRLIKRNALVTEFSAIEKLARVTTLCLDKTGTLTTGEIKFEELILYNNENQPTDILKLICKSFANKNPTLKAIYEEFSDDIDAIATNIIPFSSERKYLALDFNGSTYKLGAPEILLENEKEIFSDIEKHMNKGYRMLALTKDEQLICMLVLSDVIKENAGEVLNYFKTKSIKLKIISGDSPKTVSNIAKSLNFVSSDDYIDMSKYRLSKFSNNIEGYKKLVKKYSIFGRVNPYEKKLLIEALKKNGETVAMVGDGVNDILALKEADLAIAMANGAKAVKAVAQVTLINSDFSPLPRIFLEGRQIINNIKNVASLYLVKTIFSLILTIVFIILGQNYPFLPIYLTIIGSFAIGMPSFFLAQVKNEKQITTNFFRDILSSSLPTAVLIALFVSFFGILKAIGHLKDIETLSFFITAYLCFFKLIKQSLPFTPFKAMVISAMLILFFVSLFIPNLINACYIDYKEFILLGSSMLLGTVLLGGIREDLK
jgi:cation-transporting ATPase E